MSRTMRHGFAVLTLVTPLLLVACTSTDDAKAVAVTSGNDSCEVAKTDLPAGRTTFRVTNEGDDVTEVYVYADDDEVKGEVENIGAGTSRDFTVDLAAGHYEVACKPGMKGDGIRTAITVEGSGGGATRAPDRTVDVTATDYEYAGIDGTTYTAGETVRFAMRNDAPENEHEMEVFGPDGDAIGEVGPTEPGSVGRVTLTLTDPGRYVIKCGIDDHTAMGMKGSFTVS